MEPEKKIPFQTLESLETYQLARELRRAMYSVTRRLPEFEKYELASQIRRAAVSLTNNIAEGHGRYHYLDQLRFLVQARGSLEELIDDLNVCLDERYLSETEVSQLKQMAWRVHNVLNGYAHYLRRRKDSESSALHEDPSGYGISPDQHLSVAPPPTDERFSP